MLPQYLYRNSDGERFTCQPDGKYTMDASKMYYPYRYTYDTLIGYGFRESLEACEIIHAVTEYSRCGDEEDESC